MDVGLQTLLYAVIATLFAITGAAMLFMRVGEREQDQFSQAARWSPLAGALRDQRLRRTLGVALMLFGAFMIWASLA